MAKLDYQKANRRDLGRNGISITSDSKPKHNWNKKKKPAPGNGRELWTWGNKHRNKPVGEIPWSYLLWVLETMPPEFHRMRGTALTELRRRYPNEFTGSLAKYDAEFKGRKKPAGKARK